MKNMNNKQNFLLTSVKQIWITKYILVQQCGLDIKFFSPWAKY